MGKSPTEQRGAYGSTLIAKPKGDGITISQKDFQEAKFPGRHCEGYFPWLYTKISSAADTESDVEKGSKPLSTPDKVISFGRKVQATVEAVKKQPLVTVFTLIAMLAILVSSICFKPDWDRLVGANTHHTWYCQDDGGNCTALLPSNTKLPNFVFESGECGDCEDYCLLSLES